MNRDAPPDARRTAPPSDDSTGHDIGRAILARWYRLGLGGSIAVYLGLAALWALAVPLFLPADESPHVDYAYQVAHGHLPSAGTHFEAEFPTIGQRTGGQYVAYHPPLYYLLVAPLVRLAGATTHPRLFLLAVRGVGILLTVVMLVLIARLAMRVFSNWEPTRRYQLAIIASGLVGAVPSLTVASASIQNDAPALLFVALALLLLAVIVREGLTGRRAVILGLVCGLGMLTRVTFVQVLLVAMLTVALVAHPRFARGARHAASRARSGWAVLRLQAAYLAPIVLGPILIAGWFYLLNHSRYGSFTGSNIAYESVSFRSLTPRMRGPFHFASDPFSWWAQLLQLGGAPGWLVNNPHTVTTVIATILAVTVVLGIGAAIARRRTFGPDRDGAILLLGLALILLISFAEIASHVSHKGSENNRYLLDALPFWGIAVGVALMALGPKRYPLIPVGIVGAEVIATITLTVTIVQQQRAVRSHHGTFDALLTSMRQARVPHPAAALTGIVVLLCVGLLVQLVALIALGRRRGKATAPQPAVDDRPTSVLTP